MKYRLRTDGQIYTSGQIKRRHPNISLPKKWTQATFDSLGIDPVHPSEPPTTGEFEKFIQSGATQDESGRWVEAWDVQPMFTEYTVDDGEGNTTVITVQEQIDAKVAADNAALAESARSQRDELLKATDHFGLSDVTMSDEMTAYRQSLRDVPQQADFPNTINWPTKPE